MTEITQADTHIIGMTVAAFKTAQEQARMEERAAIVEWLRKVGGSGPEVLADMIDAGGHLE